MANPQSTSPQFTPQEIERFWAKVAVTPGCWLWTASVVRGGYGHFWVNGGHVYAHRYAYELLVGSIPKGLELDHVKARGCIHRNCVNPDHLEPVTRLENVRRGRENRLATRTHCKHGHEFTEANTWWKVTKWAPQRVCRACRAAGQRKYRTAGE